MKLFAPRYYRQFRCLADACEHSCCIGWEIDIDPDALVRYQALEHPYGAVIRDSLVMEDTPHFRLGANDRCPHLREDGLCQIICELDETHLCDICREHPRFYNFTSVVEVGLGMSCTEAARIILSSPDYAVFEEIGDEDAVPDSIDFDGRLPRNEIYTVLQNKALPYEERLATIYQRFLIRRGEDNVWRDALASLEYLDDAHRALFASYSSARRPEGVEVYAERFLAYVIYRHTTEAIDQEDFRSRLAFCLFCERLFSSLIDAENAKSLQEIAVLARILSEEIEYSEENTMALIAVAEAEA